MSRILSAVHLRTIFLFVIFTSSFSAISVAQTNFALSMNGTSTSYADLGTVAPSGNFSTGLTIECWVKWGAFNSWSRLLDMGNGASSDNILLANQGTSNNFRFEVYYGASTLGISGPSNLVTGRWYHIAVTMNSSGNAIMYVDGASVASGTVNVPKNISRTKCYIGKSNFVGDGFLNGAVDEMRIWNIVRTQAEIKQDMFRSISPGTTGLVAYYHCDENGGSTLTNSVTGAGVGNGTVQSGLSWAASPVEYSPNAMNFDGVNDFIVAPHVISSDFTLEFWMNTSSTGPGGNTTQWYGGNGLVDAEVGGVTNDWGTALTGQYVAFGIGNPDITIHSSTAVNTGNWVHVAATWKQSTGAMVLYINGVQEATGTSGTALRSAPPRITLGETQTDINRFNGSLDEVRIWNVVRTQAQIQADMNHEIDPASADASGLVSYYTFDQNIPAGTNSGVVTIIDQKGTNNATLTNFALSGSSSNFVTQSASLFALPVLFSHFSAYARGTGVQLDWSTAQEQHSASFTVQRSADGKSWSDLASLAAAGQSNQLRNYQYFDAAPLTGANYYRILQRDMDNAFMYSPVQIVTMARNSPAFVIQNTVVNTGALWLQINRPVSVDLYNLEGKMIWTKALGTGLQAIYLGRLPKGIYLVRSGSLLQKILVQ